MDASRSRARAPSPSSHDARGGGGFHFETVIVLRTVLHADKHRHAINVGIPSEMVALARRGLYLHVSRGKMCAQRFAKLALDFRILHAAFLRAVECGGAIAFTAMDVAAAHAARFSPVF